MHGCGGTLHSSEGESGAREGEAGGNPTDADTNAFDEPRSTLGMNRPVTFTFMTQTFFSSTGFAPSPASAPLSPTRRSSGACSSGFVRDVLMLPSALSHLGGGVSVTSNSRILPFGPLQQKPSIYETRVVKKFFEQHDDPDTTSGISDYVQKVGGKRAPSPAFAPRAGRCHVSRSRLDFLSTNPNVLGPLTFRF